MTVDLPLRVTAVFLSFLDVISGVDVGGGIQTATIPELEIFRHVLDYLD